MIAVVVVVALAAVLGWVAWIKTGRWGPDRDLAPFGEERR